MRIPVICLALLLPLAVPAETPDDLVQVDVLPGWTTAQGTRMVGLRLRIAPGWKTYWRAPGAAGIPPAFDWTGSENLADPELHWPVPHVFHLNGQQSIGYETEVVLPIEVTPQDPGGAARIAGEISLGVCHDICVPMTLRFSQDLPQDGKRDPAIVAALVDRPLTAEEAGVAAAVCDWAPEGEGMALRARVAIAPGSAEGDEVIVIESHEPDLWISDAVTERAGDWLVAEARVLSRSGATTVDPDRLRLTVLGPGRAVDIGGCVPG